jgi:hypothetical protein
MKNIVHWGVMLCSLVDSENCNALIMSIEEAVLCSCDVLVIIHRTTWHHTSEDSSHKLQVNLCEYMGARGSHRGKYSVL